MLFHFCELFIQALAHCFTLDSDSKQLPTGSYLLNVPTDSEVIWIISVLLLIPYSFRRFSTPIRTVP